MQEASWREWFCSRGGSTLWPRCQLEWSFPGPGYPDGLGSKLCGSVTFSPSQDFYKCWTFILSIVSASRFLILVRLPLVQTHQPTCYTQPLPWILCTHKHKHTCTHTLLHILIESIQEHKIFYYQFLRFVGAWESSLCCSNINHLKLSFAFFFLSLNLLWLLHHWEISCGCISPHKVSSLRPSHSPTLSSLPISFFCLIYLYLRSKKKFLRMFYTDPFSQPLWVSLKFHCCAGCSGSCL